MNRRTKRSTNARVALHYLVEALADRSEVSSVALVTAEGHIVAGVGRPSELQGLAEIAVPATDGEPCDRFEEVTRGTDFVGRSFAYGDHTLYLAALGSRMRRLHEAVAGVTRILNSTRA